jgi:hypothetical protein
MMILLDEMKQNEESGEWGKIKNKKSSNKKKASRISSKNSKFT